MINIASIPNKNRLKIMVETVKIEDSKIASGSLTKIYSPKWVDHVHKKNFPSWPMK